MYEAYEGLGDITLWDSPLTRFLGLAPKPSTPEISFAPGTDLSTIPGASAMTSGATSDTSSDISMAPGTDLSTIPGASSLIAPKPVIIKVPTVPKAQQVPLAPASKSDSSSNWINYVVVGGIVTMTGIAGALFLRMRKKARGK